MTELKIWVVRAKVFEDRHMVQGILRWWSLLPHQSASFLVQVGCSQPWSESCFTLLISRNYWLYSRVTIAKQKVILKETNRHKSWTQFWLWLPTTGHMHIITQKKTSGELLGNISGPSKALFFIPQNSLLNIRWDSSGKLIIDCFTSFFISALQNTSFIPGEN